MEISTSSVALRSYSLVFNDDFGDLASAQDHVDGDVTSATVGGFNVSDVTTQKAAVAGFNPYAYVVVQNAQVARTVLQPLSFFMGVFGNIMVIVIITRMKAKLRSSMDHFLLVMAISDLCSNVSNPLPPWLLRVTGFSPLLLHSVVCKLGIFLSYSSGPISAYLIVAMTMQRAISVLWPHRVGVVCTVRRIRLLILAVVIFFSLYYAHVFYGYLVRISSWDGKPSCNVLNTDKNQYVTFLNKIRYLELVLFPYLPFLLLTISNSVLVSKLRETVGGIGTQTRLPPVSATADAAAQPEVSCTPSSASSDESCRSDGAQLVAGKTSQNVPSVQQVRRRKVNSVTLTAVAVSAAFFVLTMPMTVIDIIIVATDSTRKLTDDQTALVVAVQVLAFDVVNFNASVNFYLYCLTGSRFRTEFWRLLCFWRDGATTTAEEK